MIKYASCTDPTESTVRRERVRFVEENGEIEKWKRLQARATAADFEGQSSRVFAAVYMQEQDILSVYESLGPVENIVCGIEK